MNSIFFTVMLVSVTSFGVGFEYTPVPSNPELDAKRLEFLKARTEYADFYWANQIVIDKGSAMRRVASKVGDCLPGLPKGNALDEDASFAVMKLYAIAKGELSFFELVNQNILPHFRNLEVVYSRKFFEFVVLYRAHLNTPIGVHVPLRRELAGRLGFVRACSQDYTPEDKRHFSLLLQQSLQCLALFE